MFSSAASAAFWFDASQVALLIGAGFILVGTWGAFKAGAAKERFSDARASEMEVVVAKANEGLAQAHVEIEKQRALTAKATEAAEREKLERLKLEAQLAPRYFTKEQVEKLKAALKPSDAALMIVSRMMDGESRDFADELAEGLREAGWANTARSRMWASSDAGVFVATTQATAAAPEIKVLANALKAAGVDAQVRVIAATDLRTIPEEFRDRVLYLLVARQPPPVKARR